MSQPGRKATLTSQTEAMVELSRRFSAYGPLAAPELEPPELETGGVTTTGHIGSTVEEPPDPTHFRRWVSLSIVFVITFLLSIQNTIYWHSLYPFLTEIDPTAGESFFGICIMIFNLGSTLASPLFGYWTNRIHQCKVPIIAGISMTIIGDFLLVFVEAFPTNRKWVIFAAQLISGIGVGNYGSLYAYVVMGSTLKERNTALAFRAAINSAAIMTGPALQAAFVPIGYPGFVSGPLHIDTYTAPAITNIILGFIQIAIMVTIFKEYWVGVSELDDSETGAGDGNGQPRKVLKSYDQVAAGICIWTRFTQLFCLAYDNTIGSPLTMVMFRWTPSEAVLYNGIILMTAAACDFCGNLLMGNIVLRYVQERKAILLGISVFILFFIISFPWPGLPPLVASFREGDFYSPQNVTEVTTVVPSVASNTSALSPDGSCEYVWCSYMSRIYLSQYLMAYACLAFSASVAFTPNATLFSKVLGPRKQGTLQGIFAASGQLSMTIAPIVVSTVFEYGGPRITNVIGAAVLILTVVVNVILYKRMVPWSNDELDEDAEHDDEQKPLLGERKRSDDGLGDYHSFPYETPGKEEDDGNAV